MQQDILNIRDNIKFGRYVNEAAVSQGVIQRLLHLLGWPIYNTEVVSPEYSIEGRRVDYALCHPENKPLVFIEVKQVGHSDGGDKQLFEYAFHRGIPMAILTDGKEWHFFLPGEQGNYTERRVYKLDLVERNIEEVVYRLQRYLNYKAICSHEAINLARSDYRDVARERQIGATLPLAWVKLITESDDLLIDLLADKVESLCGYKPDAQIVADFLLKNLQLANVLITDNNIIDFEGNQQITKRSRLSKKGETCGYILFGQEYRVKNGKEVLMAVLKNLAKRDTSFLGRFASSDHGRSRRYIARRREDLYPERPDLARDAAEEFLPGWWVGTNVGKYQIDRILELACKAALITYGKDLQIDLNK